MRVPESTKISTTIQNLNRSSAKSQSLSEQISSGKRVLRPSDDPLASEKISAYKTEINRGQSITRDNNYNQLWLNLVDASTNQMVELLRYSKVKALEAANSYQTEESSQVIAAEIESLMHEMLGLANTRLDKVYLYSGSKTLTPPLLENSSAFVPQYQNAMNWWLSSRAVDDDLLNELRQASVDSDLEFDISVETLSITPENKDNPQIDIAQKLTLGDYDFALRVTAEDTKESLVEKLNLAVAEKYAHAPDADFPGGKMQDVFFYLSADDKIGIQSMPNVEIDFSGDLDSLLDFQEITPEPIENEENPLGFFGEHVQGYSENDYTVRIVQPGEVGTAKYIVSDDGGKSWSSEQVLQWQNELYNPEGKPSSKVFLNFLRPGYQPYFPTGLDFVVPANPLYLYQGNDDKREVPTESTEKTNINLTANQLFFQHNSSTVNVFDVLERLKSNVEKNDISQINKQLDELDLAINQVLKYRAKSGVTTRQVENTIERIGQKSFENTKALSETEDLDLAKAATDLTQNQIQQQATMETTARVLQPSLVQFLR